MQGDGRALRQTARVKATRLEAFSDGVIAIFIAIMVLELKAAHDPSLAGLAKVLPTLLSCALHRRMGRKNLLALGIYAVGIPLAWVFVAPAIGSSRCQR